MTARFESPTATSSSLSRLHVGGDGPAGREPFKAFVCVVDEHPVLVLQVRLRLVGHNWSSWEEIHKNDIGSRAWENIQVRDGLMRCRYVLTCRLENIGIGELVKVRRVVDTFDLDGNGGGSLSGRTNGNHQ